jgi:hypothetical protein
MPQLKMSHFEYCAVFAFLASVVFGVLSKPTDRERFRYAVRCFAYFMIAVFALGWLMYLGHR